MTTHIEFAGIPGSGKTSLFPSAKLGLLNAGLNVKENKDIIILQLNASPVFKHVFKMLPDRVRRFCAFRIFEQHKRADINQQKYIKLNANSFETIVEINEMREISKNHKELVLESFLTTAGIWQMASDLAIDEICLMLDEGFIQKTVNLFVSTGEGVAHTDKIMRYLDVIPIPDMVFYINVDTLEHNLERMMKRGLPERLEGCTKPEIISFLNKSEETLNSVLNLITERGTQIIKLNNNVKQKSMHQAVIIAEKAGSSLLRLQAEDKNHD